MGVDDVVPVTYINSSAAIKAFVGEQRRRRLHLVERRAPRSSGRGRAASGSCSCPTSTWAGTPRSRWACRSTTWRCGIPTRRGAGSTPAGGDAARLLLWKGHCSVHTRFTAAADRAASRAASGHPRDRAPGSAVRRRAGGRRQRVDRVHPQARARERARIVWAVGTEMHLVNRLAARGRAGEDGPVARSARLPLLDDVPRVAEPPAVDARGASSRARSTTGSSSPTSRSTGCAWRSSGCCRSLKLGRGFSRARRPRHRLRTCMPRAPRPGLLALKRPHCLASLGYRALKPPSLLTCWLPISQSPIEGDARWPTSCPPLPYDFAALEPHIDAQTMQIHHGKHHQAYVNNLNAALEKHPELQAKSAEDLIREPRGACPRTSAPPCATTAAVT